jgi:hypothetical protein
MGRLQGLDGTQALVAKDVPTTFTYGALWGEKKIKDAL